MLNVSVNKQLNLTNQDKHLVTEKQGLDLYQELEPVLIKEQHITLDFSNIDTITTHFWTGLLKSFAHNVKGEEYQKYFHIDHETLPGSENGSLQLVVDGLNELPQTEKFKP